MNKIISITNSFENKSISLAVLFLIGLLVRANIFQNQFVMDDFDYIVNWPLIRDWKNLPQFFAGYVPLERQEGIYSPLKTLFHAVNYHLFGLQPFGYHVVSLLTHLVGIFFVFKISLYLTQDNIIAFLTGLLFAIHPVQVEAITYMTASIDMIGIVFMFIGFYLYIKAQKEPNKLNQKLYVLSLIFSLLAVFTHELAISLPLLFLWHDFCFTKEKNSVLTMLKRIAPFFIVSLLYVLAKHFVLGSITRGSYLYDSFYLTMIVILKAWAKYVFICFSPPCINTQSHYLEGDIFF